MTPAHRILLIRHGEISEEPPPLTVDEQGRPDAFGLLPRGWQRAGALTQLFSGSSDGGLPLPTRLISPRRGDPQPEKARRMAYTLGPLRELLEVDIDHVADEGQEQVLADHVRAIPDGVTLICWGHTFIPQFAARLTPQPVPQRWPDDRFDLVWSFSADPEAGYDFEQIPQRLLAGDQSDGIPLG